jgi:predicted flavoprotein YhiN
MFPVTDDSATIVDCLVQSARAAGVKLVLNCGVRTVSRDASGGFRLGLVGIFQKVL